jgi:mono/diheme cytochrome c family protein
MQSIVIRGSRAYLPSFGAIPHRPQHAIVNGRALLPLEATTQPLLTIIDADRERVIETETSNLAQASQTFHGPYDIAFGESGVAYVPLYGSDSVVRIIPQRGAPPRMLRAWRASIDLTVGGNPRGVAVDEPAHRLYSANFSSGDMSVVDLNRQAEIARLPLGPRERDRLDRSARRGKQLFYTTFRVANAANFWVGCGGCHPDGRSDGITWRLDAGLRSTPMLAGSPDTLPLHFDADRDEIADFEHTVRDLQGGFGLIDAPIPRELGSEHEPPSQAWRDIEAYLRQGIDAPRAPSPTGRESSGARVFARLHCNACHGGTHFTSSTLTSDSRRDAGTGGRFDPPSLWGVAQTAPYLHDGSAPTLDAVLRNEKHLFAATDRRHVTTNELHDLVDYLKSIDGSTIAITQAAPAAP